MKVAPIRLEPLNRSELNSRKSSKADDDQGAAFDPKSAILPNDLQFEHDTQPRSLKRFQSVPQGQHDKSSKVGIQNDDSEPQSPDVNGHGHSLDVSPQKNRTHHRYASQSVGQGQDDVDVNNPSANHNHQHHDVKLSSQDIHNSVYHEMEVPTKWVFQDNLPQFPTESKSLRVLSVTWNLHGKKPKDEDIDDLINKKSVKHHVISIGTEECLRSIPMSTLYENKSQWVNLLRNHLSPDYVMIKSQSMNALHLTIFVHKEIYTHVRDIESSQVATGIGNFIGNKGGIGICFSLYGANLLFINCHLTSGQKKVIERNADFERIMNGLELPKVRVMQEKKIKQRSKLVDRFDVVIWSGDFNYRVNQTREATMHLLKDKKLEALLIDDQFLNTRKSGKVFEGFEEGAIHFAPTYKYQGGTNLYDHTLKRIPSWTDRVLFYNGKKNQKDNENKVTAKLVNYEAIQNITMSDHRPVFAQFEVAYSNPVEQEKQEGNEKYVKVKTSACSIF